MVCYGIFQSGQLELSEAISKWQLLGGIFKDSEIAANKGKQKDTMEIKGRNRERKVRYHCFVIIIIITISF